MKYNCYPVDYINITGDYTNNHQAIDLGWWGTDSNKPIYSVNSGKVISLRNDYKTNDTSGNSYGNYIKIKNDDGSESTYAHLKYGSILVNVGDKVYYHEHLATMGDTGYAFGPHLHYEHRINGIKVNPFKYIYKYEFQDLYQNKYASNVLNKPEDPIIDYKEIKECSELLLKVVKNTINGIYGNGVTRKDNLGDIYSIVQEQVNLNYDNGTVSNPKLYNY